MSGEPENRIDVLNDFPWDVSVFAKDFTPIDTADLVHYVEGWLAFPENANAPRAQRRWLRTTAQSRIGPLLADWRVAVSSVSDLHL
jgi:hypothetical protein